jgi:hypothetical protein
MAGKRHEDVDLVVYDVADLRRLLGLGRPNAYRLARELGRRVGRRLVVARSVLERWLANQDDLGAKQAAARRRPNRRRQ